MPRTCGVLGRLLREGGPLVGVVAVGGRAQRLGAHGAGRACGAVRGQQPRVDARRVEGVSACEASGGLG